MKQILLRLKVFEFLDVEKGNEVTEYELICSLSSVRQMNLHVNKQKTKKLEKKEEKKLDKKKKIKILSFFKKILFPLFFQIKIATIF